MTTLRELVELLDRHADAGDPGSWVWDALHLARVAWAEYRELEDMVDPIDEGE